MSASTFWWNTEPNSYARVFGYEEEGRLTKIERDYGNGNLQTAYEYGYTGDGVRVWKRDLLNQQEYRYVCRIGCGGAPMRVYNRAVGGASWASVEDYLPAGNALGYGWNWRFAYSGGELLMMGVSGQPLATSEAVRKIGSMCLFALTASPLSRIVRDKRGL